jgi:hypothetical protein
MEERMKEKVVTFEDGTPMDDYEIIVKWILNRAYFQFQEMEFMVRKAYPNLEDLREEYGQVIDEMREEWGED